MNSYSVDTVALRKIMFENGYNTITSLAVKAKISRNTLGKVLDGSLRPSVEVMDKLVYALKLSPEISGAVFFADNLRIT